MCSLTKFPGPPAPAPTSSLTASPPPRPQNAPLHYWSYPPPTISTNVYDGAQATRKQRREYNTTSDTDQQQDSFLMTENVRKVRTTVKCLLPSHRRGREPSLRLPSVEGNLSPSPEVTSSFQKLFPHHRPGQDVPPQEDIELNSSGARPALLP